MYPSTQEAEVGGWRVRDQSSHMLSIPFQRTSRLGSSSRAGFGAISQRTHFPSTEFLGRKQKGQDFKMLSFGELLQIPECLVPLSLILHLRDNPAPSLGHLPGYGSPFLGSECSSVLRRLSIKGEGLKRPSLRRMSLVSSCLLAIWSGRDSTEGALSPSLSGCSQILLQPACTGSAAEAQVV